MYIKDEPESITFPRSELSDVRKWRDNAKAMSPERWRNGKEEWFLEVSRGEWVT